MVDHKKAKAIYESYLAREAVLVPRRDYARCVAEATGGSGQTPVEPLATMGKNGGPLLCDVCGKPMILEGDAYQGVFADEGWRRNPTKGWVSWIAGGMVAEKNSVCRLGGKSAMMRLTSWMKPMSSMRSASSRIAILMRDASKLPRRR